MKKSTIAPADVTVNPTTNHPDQPAETTTNTATAGITYPEPVNAEVRLLPEAADQSEAAQLLQVLAEAEQTEPADETPAPAAPVAPEPEPAPAPVLSKAELLAERALKLQQLNLITEQLEKLRHTSGTLENFMYFVENDEERRFASIQIVDDKANRWTTQNRTLCDLLTEYLRQLIAGKVDEKEAELLGIQL